MTTLLQITPVRPDIQAELDAAYTILRAEPGDIGDAWLAAHGAEVQGVVTGGHIGLPSALMTAMPNLGVIAIHGVGFDKVDLELARSRGVRVANTPDVLTDDVADLAVGLTLALLRQLHRAHAHVQAGKWPTAEMPISTKLTGKRIGIFGLGRIGRAAARRFSGFSDAIGYCGNTRQDVPYTYYPDPVALAAASDILVVCAAASERTRRIIGRAVFDALGPKGFLVNVARGSIVDEPELVAALRENRLAGAALDVFENEPNVPAELLSMPHVVLTPHIASGTYETRRAMGDLVLANLHAYFAGEPLPTALV